MRKSIESGYILPATIMLSLAILTISTIFLQYIASASISLNSQVYMSIAEEAAQSGIAYTRSCIAANEVNWTMLTPDKNCKGVTQGTIAYSHKTDEWESTFTVTKDPIVGGRLTATSVGIVRVIRSGITIAQKNVTQKITLPSTMTNLALADGDVITDLSTESHSCAIANGKLYCWGLNVVGQLGIGNATNQTTPQLVAASNPGDPFYGKIVTKVIAGHWNTCAIADAQLYCWGDNDFGQLGIGTTSPNNELNPLPVTAATSRKITSLSLTDSTYYGPKSACAIADGVGYCWGENHNQQLGQAKYCWFFGYYVCSSPDQDDRNLPTPLWGYHTESGSVETGSPLYQKKMTSIAVGEGQGAGIANGQFYEWGNPNDGGWSTLYRVKLTNTGALAGKMVDPFSARATYATWCGIAQGNMICWGYNWRPLWGGSAFGIPAQLTPTTYYTGNITSYDGGLENTDLTPDDSLDCVISNGIIYCSGAGSYTATGYSGSNNWQPVITTSDMTGRIPTKIGVGYKHACFVANGSLLCWGHENDGQLANGALIGDITYPQLVASSTFGSSSGTGVASGAISVGGDHSCATVNAQLFCWGKNADGQLGIGDTVDRLVPVSVFPANTVVTKVSAGTNHTCAISNAQLYCWGDNTYGQLGIGTSGTDSNSPQLVSSFVGKYVTDVSAGDAGTCAIADNQAYCWGLNDTKQLGIGNSNGCDVSNPGNKFCTTPQPVSGNSGILTGKEVSAISMGKTHACAVANGNGYCWGSNTQGELGIGTTSTSADPTQITGGTAAAGVATIPTATFTGISAGTNFSCGIINGVVGCWGKNLSGQLGNGNNTSQTSPVALTSAAGSMQADAISAGDSHACANLQGRTYCWGLNTDSQLGAVVGASTSTPQLINGGDNGGKATINVDAGTSSTCNVANGRIQCWGLGTSGKLGNNGVTSEPLPKTWAIRFRTALFGKA